ncbi:hypothetical protein V2P20_01325 [Methylobacter sp. Wu1]|uniref:hypothetical protein n=1 Tax=Methylobacter sp. Wu1 TaxID=3119359 RepID=UPI002F9336EB
MYYLNIDGLLVLDRGFPAIWLFALCQQRHFLAFIDGSLWPGVQAFAVGNLWKHIATRPVGRDTRRASRTLDIEGLPDGIAPSA